jgi:hypothetical protein
VTKRHLAIALTIALVFGCSSGGKKHGESREQGRPAGEARDLSRLPDELHLARLMGSGPGSVKFTADHNGKVYLYDRADRQIVYRGNVQAGQTIEIVPNDNGIVRIDNKFAGRSSKRYQPDHEYDVYFRG